MSANPFDSSAYSESRPDLLVNWQRANDPSWLAQNPGSQGVADYINQFGSLDAYLRADAGVNPAISEKDAPATGINSNYSGNPFDPYSTTGSENTYVPGQGDTSGQIPVNTDPSIIGSSTYDPTAGLTPNNNLPINMGDGLNMGGGTPGGSGGGGIFGVGNGGMALPIPGINLPAAIGASILLSNGNIFGGGSGGLSGLANSVGNIAANPVGAVDSSITNLGNSVMGPTTPTQGAATAGVIAFPTGNSGNGSTPTPNPVPAPNQPNGQTIAFPAPVAPTNPAMGPVANPITNMDTTPKTTVIPVTPPGPAPTNPTDTPNQPPTVLAPIPVTPPGPAPTNPTTPTGGTDIPKTPTIPVVPVGTGGGGSTPVNPVVVTPVPTTPMPDTSVVSPLDRNFYNEGSQSTSDLQRLLGGIAGLYSGASGSAGQTDFTNWQSILSQFGAQNQNLTGLSNDQTQAANTALRTNNLNDVQNLLPQATAIRNAANPGLLGDSGSLQNYSNGAASFLQQAQQQQNDANFLSPQEMNTAQQTARNAWSARGLVNSPGAVGAEILNTDAALRGRQQQAFQNTGNALGVFGQNVNAQQQNQFDPFNAILGSAYGQQTNNAGSNSNLYGQSSAFSSGAQGDQYAQNITNPFSPYIQDLNSGNFNAENARNIAASNNAAAVQGANTAQNSALANSFLKLFGQYALNGSCWVAREIFGEDDSRWMQFRYWMLNVGPVWFRKLYLKHGERFAAWLHNNEWLKPTIRDFMEKRIARLSAKERALSLIELSRPEIRPLIVALAYSK